MNSISGVPVLDSYYNNLTFNPILILVVIVVIVLYFILFGSLGGGIVDEYSNDSNSTSFKLLGIIIASLFIVLTFINGFN